MTPDSFRLRVKFWGVRGSTPTPESDHLGYGGNTTCIEVQAGDGARIIVDAGSGIRKLGLRLMQENPSQKLDLFLTHFHWDHIQGIPFFAPLLNAGNKISFHSFPDSGEIRRRLERQMSCPYFTLEFERLQAARDFIQLEGVYRNAGMRVMAFPLHHPQGACGYRIEFQGAVAVIATDLEHGDPVLDKTLREHSEGADVLIYDAQYTPAEYQKRQGWGHSTYAAAAAVARDAKVKKLILSHHDPVHTDTQMDNIVSSAASSFENTAGARELQTICL